MKKVFYLMISLFVIMGCQPEKNTDLKVITFNIRYDNPGDSPNNWDARKVHVYDFIKERKPDVMGMQEVLHSQLLDLKSNLPLYDFIGVGRDDGKTEGEYSPVAYLRDKFEKLDGNTFWLSEYPDSVGLMGWDAVCTRIATWAKLKDKSNGKIFMVVNTHFDHIGREARNKSALLIIDKIKEIVGDNPAILTGDFNVTDASSAYKTITTNEFKLVDAHKIAGKVSGETETFQNFGRNSEDTGDKIDFVFVTSQIKVKSSEIPSSLTSSGLYLSDHNPQIVEISF